MAAARQDTRDCIVAPAAPASSRIERLHRTMGKPPKKSREVSGLDPIPGNLEMCKQQASEHARIRRVQTDSDQGQPRPPEDFIERREPRSETIQP